MESSHVGVLGKPLKLRYAASIPVLAPINTSPEISSLYFCPIVVAKVSWPAVVISWENSPTSSSGVVFPISIPSKIWFSAEVRSKVFIPFPSVSQAIRGLATDKLNRQLLTFMLTVAILLSITPSFTINVKLSDPSYNGFGVYTTWLFSISMVPFTGSSTMIYISSSPFWSVAVRVMDTAVSSSVVTSWLIAIGAIFRFSGFVK